MEPILTNVFLVYIASYIPSSAEPFRRHQELNRSPLIFFVFPFIKNIEI